MYMVVSEWEPLPGHEDDFMRAGTATATLLRQQPGVMTLEVFRSGNKAIAVVGYRDEATYHKLIDDPNGVFAREHERNRVEDFARWVRSERGETFTFTETGAEPIRRAA